jgi:membrane-associated phospholipid phosphatase
MNRLLRSTASLRPEEAIALLFFTPSAAITLRASLFFIHLGQPVPPRIAHGLIRLAVTALLGVAYAAFVMRKPLWDQLSWLRDLMPFAFCIAIYTNLHDTIHFVNSHDVQDSLIRIDVAMFGVEPVLWAQRFYRPWLTDLFSLAYMNYFLLSISVVVTLLATRRRVELREALFGTVLCFYFGYVLYIAFPAAPPWVALGGQFTVPLTGHWVTQMQKSITVGNPTGARGAFPSLHCAITLITLLYAWRFSRRLFWVLVLPGALLIASTVYLRHHYVIDILVGFALAVFTFVVAPKVDRAWERLHAGAREDVLAPEGQPG